MARQPKHFKVVGTQPILDHLPGEEFSAVLPKSQERFLIDIGGLEEVKEKVPVTKDKPDKS
jgi:hypothetical protein